MRDPGLRSTNGWVLKHWFSGPMYPPHIPEISVFPSGNILPDAARVGDFKQHGRRARHAAPECLRSPDFSRLKNTTKQGPVVAGKSDL
jgi:hypothetical protein